MFSLSLEEITLIGLSFALLEFTGILLAVHAVLHVRTSQGAIAWGLSLVTAPLIALPLYAFFGQRKLEGYVWTRRCGDIAIVQTFCKGKIWRPHQRHPESRRKLSQTLENLSDMIFTGGNSAELLVNGQATFDAIFETIDSARNYILVEFFIIHNDELGQELKRRLIERLRVGVQVYFLYDSIGCYALPKSYRRELEEAGAEVREFGSPGRFRNRYQINFRNHRKVVVVDGMVGFAGGHNVGNEYLGKVKRFGPWRDTHLKLSGPSVMGSGVIHLWRVSVFSSDPLAAARITSRSVKIPTSIRP